MSLTVAILLYVSMLLFFLIGYIIECRKDGRQRQESINKEFEKSSTIKVEEDPNTGDLFFPLDKVLEGTNVNPNDVVYYELVEKDGIIVLTLYDKDKKQIKVS